MGIPRFFKWLHDNFSECLFLLKEGQNFDFLNLGNTILADKYKKLTKIKIEESYDARKEIEKFFKKKYLFRFKSFVYKFLNG